MLLMLMLLARVGADILLMCKLFNELALDSISGAHIDCVSAVVDYCV